jgi:hypothetical protein
MVGKAGTKTSKAGKLLQPVKRAVKSGMHKNMCHDTAGDSNVFSKTSSCYIKRENPVTRGWVNRFEEEAGSQSNGEAVQTVRQCTRSTFEERQDWW